MLFRANTARHGLPQSHRQLLRHREEIQERTRQLFSHQSSRSSERKISAAMFATTTRTSHFFKPHSQQEHYRDKPSPFNIRPESTPLRPLTQQKSRCHRASSPLSVIKTKSKALSSFDSQFQKQKTIRKINFLRRGQATDKAIIYNILKSKMNHNVCAPTVSYCDHSQNKQLIAVISSQIPKGIKDVVGVEEMLRMSHIFTGTQFMHSNIPKRIKTTLSQIKMGKKAGNIIEEDDNITLKSIKRW